jgi:hypothetical protein
MVAGATIRRALDGCRIAEALSSHLHRGTKRQVRPTSPPASTSFAQPIRRGLTRRLPAGRHRGRGGWRYQVAVMDADRDAARRSTCRRRI